MCSRWAEKPCKKFCPVDEDIDNPECGFCGWSETEHYPRKDSIEMSETNKSNSIIETLVNVVAELAQQVDDLRQQIEIDMAEVKEKLDNVSKPGGDYGIYNDD